MAKKPTLHPYADRQAFDRLMALIATLIQHPGVGCAQEDESDTGEHHNALAAVRDRWQQTALDLDLELPDYSLPTFRKDLETLRRYGILERRMYRQGYYLGTGAMNRHELHVAFEALASAAKYQASPQARRVYQTLAKRLRGFDLEVEGLFFYPVRQNLNRAIHYTDPEEMMAKGENRNNLFHQLEAVERAICHGQAIEVSRHTDPYERQGIGPIQVWPLQLIYYDVAWYLIYECCSNNHLAVGRIDRFQNYCQILTPTGRGLAAQQQSLAKAHKLLENGWGLNLGDAEEQRAELAGEAIFETVKVRFFPPVTTFILEGDRRHLRQKITVGPKDPSTKQPLYADYAVPLPPRSFSEFLLWVRRYLDRVQVLSPANLA